MTIKFYSSTINLNIYLNIILFDNGGITIKIDKNECPPFLNDFFTYQRVVCIKSERTCEAYYIDLRLFLRYLKMTKLNLPSDTPLESIEIKDISIDMLKSFTKLDALNYLNYVASERNNSPKTRARKLSSLKMFFKCLNSNINVLTVNPVKDIDFPKLPQTLPKYLTLNDSIKLLTNFDTESPYFTRDYCIVTLLINCGMRLSELVGLNIQDIDFYEQSMRLLGKGNKERIIHLNSACVDALKAYLEDRKLLDTPEKALFLSKQYRRISGRRVEQIVISSLKACNLDNRGITTHKLRHTAATLMYQYGNVDTLVLKEILGHKSIATTEIYTHISNDSIKDAMDASPLADINKKPHKQ